MVRARADRRPRRLAFSTQTLLLQLGVLLLVILTSGALYVWLTYQRLTWETEARALAVAQSVAADTDLRRYVSQVSLSGTVPSNRELRRGPVQTIGEEVRRRTGALFVVVTDDEGLRLSHPVPARLGEKVSTSPAAALSGKEVVALETGTLGPSARAKVPVWSTGRDRIVGEVSVGFSTQSILASAVPAIVPIASAALGALLLGALVSAALMRRLRKLTLGLEPEEMSALVQDQEVVLHGVNEGVIGVAADGRITVCNARARRLLRLGDVTGKQISSVSVPAPILAMLETTRAEAVPTVQVVVGPSVLLVSARKVLRGSNDLGWVLTVLDRTQVEELTRQLDAVGALTTALRVQRHEFANRLHTLSGLLDIGEVQEASRYLRQTLETGPLKYPVEHGDRLQDSYLQAFVGAKGFQASERSVLLKVGAGTLIRGAVTDPQDITTVLGNLIDNAVEAAVQGSNAARWVEIELLSEGDTLHIVVEDSGDGVAGDPALPFIEGHSGRAPDQSGHGEGLGLPLSRRIARNRGGDVWLASSGTPGGPGAVFCARLPGVLTRDEKDTRVVSPISAGGGSGPRRG